MKIKTSELTGPALDWAVAKLQKADVLTCATGEPTMALEFLSLHDVGWANYSTDWAQGGPLLTEARISRTVDHSGLWIAYWTSGYVEGDAGRLWMQCDRSELVAGLRCYVALNLGGTVDVPDELA